MKVESFNINYDSEVGIYYEINNDVSYLPEDVVSSELIEGGVSLTIKITRQSKVSTKKLTLHCEPSVIPMILSHSTFKNSE